MPSRFIAWIIGVIGWLVAATATFISGPVALAVVFLVFAAVSAFMATRERGATAGI